MPRQRRATRCHKCTRWVMNLKRHLARHETQELCPRCGVWTSDLEAHEKRHQRCRR